jgi:hypothetical protein
MHSLTPVRQIADRLCCSFGQDLLDSLFSQSTLGRRKDGTQPHVRPFALFSLSVIYISERAVSLYSHLLY